MASSSSPLVPSLAPLQSPSSSSSPSHSPFSPPSSILIIGAGVFGLGTALALARRHEFSQCSITIVDRSDPAQPGLFPARDAASIDSSRIIRADYPDAAYAALAAEAQAQWRKQANPSDLGAQGRYHESGLLLVADGVPPPANAPPAAAAAIDKAKLTGMDYARLSWANVLSLASDDHELANHIRELPDAAAIREAARTGGGGSGTWGYINHGSGWADATASMAWLFDQVQQTGRITFVAGTANRLERSGSTVTGARLADGRVLSADLVVLAAGAWTGGLLDISGRAIATGQVLGYLEITQDEQDQLSKMPVILNLTTGLFVIPPSNGILKVARHAYGYANPETLDTEPLPLSPLSPPSTHGVSLPRTHMSDPTSSIPPEGAEDLRRALHEMVPLPGLPDRPFIKTRLCWYQDTPTADFIVDYHPEWQGLFVATGDSGHGFKFLPVLGEKIADCIMGNCPSAFKDKWAWKHVSGETLEKGSVVTEDGSRGGLRRLVLQEELGKATAPQTA
ncbi:putative fructosyl amino acid protein [Cercophora scortea]|uniref:Fructosyl amino acid protein n=1 Tax=Cercophora scortea TaxID=314031 RepID=A0AAE0IX15_9PEZI|nr:putative fructosyl amino acid protein [Cercophora scortea]